MQPSLEQDFYICSARYVPIACSFLSPRNVRHERLQGLFGVEVK